MLDETYRAIVRDKFPDRQREVVDRQIDEVEKFLSLISTRGGRFIPLTKDADDVWHEMIVQTRLYSAFCQTLPGKRFVNHESVAFEEYADRIGRDEAVAQFLSWIPDYVSTYGEFTPETAADWAVVRFLVEDLGLSLHDVNSLGSTGELPPAFVAA